ncbi:MAG TPA: hypothetical protein VF272_01850 [Candidatus Saccharimonadia bacterium]
MKLSKLQILVAAGSLTVFGGLGFWIAESMASQNSNPIHHVSLTSQGADPNVIAVVKGGYVQFDAKDGKQHKMSQGSGDDEVHHQAHTGVHEHQSDGKDSGMFGLLEAYRVQFHQTGTFSFHDHLNPKLSITVVVYEAGRKK